MHIKEIRGSTGLTQVEFAKKFEIPLGTLRRWEQGESRPAPYYIKLLLQQLPIAKERIDIISDKEGNEYYYDKNGGRLIDSKGNIIPIKGTLDGVKAENLPLYVHDLFEDYYEIINRFYRDCLFDKEEDIIWK